MQCDKDAEIIRSLVLRADVLRLVLSDRTQPRSKEIGKGSTESRPTGETVLQKRAAGLGFEDDDEVEDENEFKVASGRGWSGAP